MRHKHRFVELVGAFAADAGTYECLVRLMKPTVELIYYTYINIHVYTFKHA